MSGLEGLLAGRLLADRYRIEEVIGRGGMGAVYRATDERLGRQVAVKVITVSGGAEAEARDRLRARFYREARAAAALPHHPNVVPVYDYGSDPALQLDFIVMELLRGHDLSTRLARSGPPPLSTGIRILYEAARGVAVGHRAGLIHRDIKPGNIFLAETDQSEVQVRVVDFGIAKLADEDESLSQLTQDGRVPHSPAFASPEQLRGLSSLTPASDVFSLGAVGFTLLTGERPFSESDRNRMALGMSVPAPSLRDRNPAIPTAIEAIVQKALAFDPEDRFPEAGEMANAVGDALRGLPDAPVEPYAAGLVPGTPLAAEDDERTHAIVAAGSGAAAGVPPADDDRTRVMAADEDDRTLLAPPPRGKAPAPAPDRIPPRAFPRREPPKRRSGGIIVWMIVLLVLAAAAYVLWMEMGPRQPGLTLRDSIPPAPDSLPTLTPETTIQDTIDAGQPELQALVLNQEGLAYFNAGDIAAAVENFRLASEFAPDHPDYVYNYGLALMRQGNLEEATAQLQRATRLDPGRTAAHYNLGLTHLTVGDTVAAWNSLERARDLAQTPAERAPALQQLRAIEQAQRAAAAAAAMDTARTRRPDTTTVASPPRGADSLFRMDPRPTARDTLTAAGTRAR